MSWSVKTETSSIFPGNGGERLNLGSGLSCFLSFSLLRVSRCGRDVRACHLAKARNAILSYSRSVVADGGYNRFLGVSLGFSVADALLLVLVPFALPIFGLQLAVRRSIRELLDFTHRRDDPRESYCPQETQNKAVHYCLSNLSLLSCHSR